jgi:hypothetical protein
VDEKGQKELLGGKQWIVAQEKEGVKGVRIEIRK